MPPNEALALLPQKEILRVLWPFLKANMPYVTSTALLMTVSSVANVLIPYLGKELIDDPHQGQHHVASAGDAMGSSSDHLHQQHGRVFLSKDEIGNKIIVRALMLMGTFITYHAISCWGHLQAYKLGMFMSNGMIKKAVEALAVVPWEDTIQQNPAEYSQTLVQASRFAGDTVASLVTNMYPNLIGVVGFAVMVLFMSPSLTILFGIVVAVVQGLQRYRQARINTNSAVVSQQEAKTLAVVTNTIQRSALIRLFNCSDFILSKLDICAKQSIESAADLNFAIHSNAALGSGTTNCLFVLIIAIMAWYRAQEEVFSTLDIALFFMYMGQLLSRVVSVANDVNQLTTLLQRTVPFVMLMRKAEQNGKIAFSLYADGSHDVKGVNTADDKQVSSQKKTSSADDNDIVVELDNVGFVYNKAFGASAAASGGNDDQNNTNSSSAVTVDLFKGIHSPTATASSLRNISLQIKRGQFVGIVGSSGGGKTTILRIIAGLITPTMGTLTLREKITMLEQGSSIVVGSVEENIRIGNPSASLQQVQHAATVSGSAGFISQLPAGFSTLLENIDVSGLSGGQLQRICLARVFLSDANVVLFDEPTTGLDPVSTEKFFETAMRLREQGRTIILVTHEHQLVAKADVVVAVRAGEIVGKGSYDALKPLLASLHDHH